MKTLTVLKPDDDARFKILEDICSKGRAVFFMVGSALAEIKRKEFYRAKGFDDFAAYCESIGYSKRHCNQLIADADVVNSLPEDLRKLIRSEQSARALSMLPPQLQLEVVVKAAEAGKPSISSGDVRRLAPPPRPAPRRELPAPGKRSAPPERPKPAKEKVPTDATGLEIPNEILPLWNRYATDELGEILAHVSTVRAALRRAQEQNDPLFKEVDFIDDTAKLNQVYEDLKRIKPYAVCNICQGKKTGPCPPCKDRGFVSEHFWFNCVPEQVRELRKKIVAGK